MDSLGQTIALVKNGSAERLIPSTSPAILVVDDEQNFVALLNWYLGKKGYEVRTALDGDEALRLIDERPADLAVLDIRMGPMDGLSLLDQLKRRLPDIKVIMMTAYPTTAVIQKSYTNGASGFLTKPLDLEELLKTIRDLS
jgi:DNA-binding NtrC family response regulator